jgi:hypothetical protein
MGLEANVVYLEEEIKNLHERIAMIRSFLQANPSASIYRRSINGKVHYYKKFHKESKLVSKLLGNSSFDFKGALKKLKAENEKFLKAKVQLAKLRIEMLALKKQAKIAKKALKQIRAYNLKKS